MSTIKNTWHHIRRSPFQSFTALLVMVFSFLIISVFIIVNSGLSGVLNYFETKPEITIFIKDGLDKTAIENVQKDLASYTDIKEIKYVSKDRALEIYKQENKDNPMLTEMVTASILPASFEITVSNPNTLEQIYQNYATKNDVVDEIIYQKDIINSLLDWTSAIRKTGLALTLIIGFISFFTIFIIIGMKITNRKEEIRISRLLGASHLYVKKPFLLEGLFYGVAGSLIGSIISFSFVIIFRQSINAFFQPVEFISYDIAFYGLVLGSELLLGCFIGLLASWIGVKRYIKF
jgi:cell division transport system permease protein